MKPFLCVDFYKTISFGHLWHCVSEPQRTQVQDLIFKDGLQFGIADQWHRGVITSEEVNRYAATKLGIDYQTLWDLFVRSSETIGVVDGTLEIITKLQTKYVTVLVTDNLDSLDRFTAPAYEFNTVFNHVINSSAVGIRKSDDNGLFFKLVTKNFTDSVLLDDKEENCSTFATLGGTGLLVTKEQDALFHLKGLL